MRTQYFTLLRQCGVAAATITSSSFASFSENIAGAALPHLVETPEYPTAEVATGLKALAFECFACRTRIVDTNSLQRITVRSTPLSGARPRPQTDGTASAVATALFVTKPHNVVDSPDRRLFPLVAVPEQTYQRDMFCGHCKRYVGYRLEDEAGQPLDLPGRPAYKLWYKCVDDSAAGPSMVLNTVTDKFLHKAKCVGSALSLVDEAPYRDLLKILPPPPPVRAEPPTSLERTARVSQATSSDLKLVDAIASQARDEIALATARVEQGEYYMRAMAPEEGDPHRKGLQARKKDAKISPAKHVDGVRDSQFISASGDLGVVLLWTLPYGLPVVIVPRFALRTGTTINKPDAVLEAIELSADVDNNKSKRLLPLAQSSAEALVVGAVDEAAVEEVRSHIHKVTLGPEFPPSHGATGDTGDSVSFPATVHDWSGLEPVAIPASDGDDRQALLQTAFGDRTASDYFARRGVIGLARPGSTEPAFLLFRMTPNGLPGLPLPEAGTPGPDRVNRQKAWLRGALEAGGKQLRDARAEVVDSAANSPDFPIAYYELDYRLWQQRVVFPSLNGYVVERVPVLLVPWRRGALAAGIKLCDIKGKHVPRRDTSRD